MPLLPLLSSLASLTGSTYLSIVVQIEKLRIQAEEYDRERMKFENQNKVSGECERVQQLPGCLPYLMSSPHPHPPTTTTTTSTTTTTAQESLLDPGRAPALSGGH